VAEAAGTTDGVGAGAVAGSDHRPRVHRYRLRAHRRAEVEKHSWLWWLSGKAKDAEQIETEKNRRQTDQRLGQQEAQKEQADKAEEN
jgi:hypothetical protein